jgi:glucose/arabinose dehydrogenase
VSGLSAPTAAAFAPDGRLFVLEKAGGVRAWSPATGLAPAPLATLPSCTDSEMGLLGLAFDPGFARNGFLYLYHTQPPGGVPARCAEGVAAGRQNRVVRVTVSGDRIDLGSLVVLRDGIRTDNGNHDGGCLRVGPDGLLYVGVGDSGRGDGGAPGDSTNPYARDLASLNGKILRLTLDGAPAPGNPFLGRGGAADFVFAYGLRNPFRFSFDVRTGLLWVGDVGQNTFEEVDVVHAGDDLGWPMCEGFAPASQCPGGTVPPIHVYAQTDPGSSVTGGVFYEGQQFDPAFRGDYFFGDFVFDIVWRARVDAARTGFDGEPDVFVRDAGSPVDFTVGPDGALYYVAFSRGQVMRIAEDRAGGAPTGCSLALVKTAPGRLQAAGRRPAACVPGCPSPRLSRPLRARLRRACPVAPPGLCERLGCAPCATSADLGSCLGAAAAGIVTEVVHADAPQDDDRCFRAARRAAVRAAARRLRAIAGCARSGGGACVTAAPAPRVTGLAGACRTPPAAACTAFACLTCATAADLASCVGQATVAPVDALARALLGG